MRECRWKNDLAPYLPDSIYSAVSGMDRSKAERLEEIRVRIYRPLQLLGGDYEILLPDICPNAELIEKLMDGLNEHSAYAHERERQEGFFTLPGGYRVGICGRRGAGESMSCISGLNIRIAKEWKGCADSLMNKLMNERGRPVSALLLSAPGVGKTTMLRDIARQFSDVASAKIKKIAIADERSEIAGCTLGIPSLDVGGRTDVMDGYPKAKAIRMLIRSMSPELIITDEIGGAEDAAALREASRCGVSIIASAHAPDSNAAKERYELAPLLQEKLFLRIVELYRENGCVKFRVA